MISNFFKNKYFINLLIIIIIFSIDRMSKAYVVSLMDQNFNLEIFLTSFLNISLIWNEGVAFGLLSFQNDFFYNLITILISLIILILMFLTFRTNRLKKYSYIGIIGGALGNLFDRITYRAVPDFIDFHFNGFHWFIFNIADIFITLGVICLIYDEVFLQKKEYE